MESAKQFWRRLECIKDPVDQIDILFNTCNDLCLRMEWETIDNILKVFPPQHLPTLGLAACHFLRLAKDKLPYYQEFCSAIDEETIKNGRQLR